MLCIKWYGKFGVGKGKYKAKTEQGCQKYEISIAAKTGVFAPDDL